MAEADLTTSVVWKDVPSLDGIQMSSFARCRSFRATVRSAIGWLRVRTIDPIPITIHHNLRGYDYVRLSGVDGIWRTHQVHRLVLEAFVGPCPPDHEGCHKDGSRTNNRPENLYWGTRQQNHLDARRHGRIPNLKLSDDKLREMLELRRSGWSQKRIAEHFGLTKGHISKVLIRHGMRSNHKPFTQVEIGGMREMQQNGLTYTQIAKALEIKPDTVMGLFEKLRQQSIDL